MKLEIRKVKPEEAATLTDIAFTAKRYWGYPESWIEAWREELTITSDYIQSNIVFAAEENDRLIGFYAMVTLPGKTELDHLWVLPEAIGKGIGRQLLEHAIGQVMVAGGNKLEIVSDPNAEGFYLKAGAKRIGEVISEIEGRQRKLPRLKIEIQS